jgi:hypothetical protein
VREVREGTWGRSGRSHGRAVGQRLPQALDQVGRADVRITFEPVETDDEGAAVSFAGSPTFTVDGVDLFETGTLSADWGPGACRAGRSRPTRVGDEFGQGGRENGCRAGAVQRRQASPGR